LQFDFGSKHLVELYTQGHSRKYKLPPAIVKKFIMRVDQIEAATTIHDFWKTPSLNFEKMQGEENQYSMRIDKGWRLEMEIVWTNKEKTIGDVTILDITKHYGD